VGTERTTPREAVWDGLLVLLLWGELWEAVAFISGGGGGDLLWDGPVLF
jgi:hypothetical protein